MLYSAWKRRWKYFKQTADDVRQDLNQVSHSRDLAGVGKASPSPHRMDGIHLLPWDPWVSGWCETHWDQLAGTHMMACVWGCSAGSLIYVLVWLLPQKTACRCPWEGESWLSELSIFSLAISALLPWLNVFCQKNVPSYIFFSTGFMETLCLSSPGIPAAACPSCTYQVLPWHWEGLLHSDAHGQNGFALDRNNEYTFMQIKSLFFVGTLGFDLTGGWEVSVCSWSREPIGAVLVGRGPQLLCPCLHSQNIQNIV